MTKKFLLIFVCILSIWAKADIRTLRVQYLSTWEKRQLGEKIDPQRVQLIAPSDSGEWEIDGSDQDNTLEISFDEMSHDVKMYSYRVEHHNADGSMSKLISNDYLSGFTTAEIQDYSQSVNTAQPYTHYRFTFPNQDMRIRRSGLYTLKIYEDGNPDNTVAEVTIPVVEPRVGIQAKVRANTAKEFNGRYQQLDIDIHTEGLDLRDPNDITLIVKQNGRTDNQVIIKQPTYIDGKWLRYQNQPTLIFEGGNEYRHYDTYSTYFAGQGVDRIRYSEGEYHAFLFMDELRGQGAYYAGERVSNPCGTPYMHEYDADGLFVVNAERTQDADTEAEYMWVHHVLPADQPWLDGYVYIGGEFTGNTLTNANRMLYDYDQRCYYLNLLVKQGGVDYQYWFAGKSVAPTLLRTEGSHWQTENEYTIEVYYHPFGARYDQLVGLQRIKGAM